MSVQIGVDLGGTNLRAALFDPGDPTPKSRLREELGEPRDPATVVEKIAAEVEQLAGPGTEPVTVGVGIAAMLRDRVGTVANSPHLRWRDVPFGRLLATRLGARYQLGVYNDVNAIAYGETMDGAARGCRDVLVVFVGTGIGGGLVVDGKLVEGTTNCAGEIGHVKVRWDDDAAPCACGQRGCVEAYVGGSYVADRIAAELAAGATTSAIALAGGIELVTPGHVDQAAAAGDPWALDLWTELAPLLAVALGNAVTVLNSERLVLGGGFLGRAPTLYELVVGTLPMAVTSAIFEPLTVVPAELGDDAGLIGSARLAAAGVSIIP